MCFSCTLALGHLSAACAGIHWGFFFSSLTSWNSPFLHLVTVIHFKVQRQILLANLHTCSNSIKWPLELPGKQCLQPFGSLQFFPYLTFQIKQWSYCMFWFTPTTRNNTVAPVYCRLVLLPVGVLCKYFYLSTCAISFTFHVGTLFPGNTAAVQIP